MRVYKIDLVVERLHVDLDHIQMLEPPKDGPRGYGFDMWMSFRDYPVVVSVLNHQYCLELRKQYVDIAFEKLYTEWSGKDFEP